MIEIYSFESVDAYQLMVEAVSDVILGKPAWTPPHSESLFVMNLINQIRTKVGLPAISWRLEGLVNKKISN